MLVHSPFILIVKLLLGCHHIIEEHEADKFSARETTKDLVFEYIDDQLSILNIIYKMEERDEIPSFYLFEIRKKLIESYFQINMIL